MSTKLREPAYYSNFLNLYQNIPGWFSEEAKELFEKAINEVTMPATFVEVGSWKGKSTVCMAARVGFSGKSIKFFCIDPWSGQDGDPTGAQVYQQDQSVISGTLYEEFLKNLKPVEDVYTPLRTTSLEASHLFQDGSIDFLYLDACHSYEEVLADLKAWVPKIKSHGIICGDDYVPQWEGVIRAVDEFFGKANVKTKGVVWQVHIK